MKYFVKDRLWGDTWVEVSKEKFVKIERLAGFNNTMGQPDEPATSGFSGRGWEGKVSYEN